MESTWSHLEAIREFGSAAQELAARSSRVRSGASGRHPLALTASRMLSSESSRLELLSCSHRNQCVNACA